MTPEAPSSGCRRPLAAGIPKTLIKFQCCSPSNIHEPHIVLVGSETNRRLGGYLSKVSRDRSVRQNQRDSIVVCVWMQTRSGHSEKSSQGKEQKRAEVSQAPLGGKSGLASQNSLIAGVTALLTAHCWGGGWGHSNSRWHTHWRASIEYCRSNAL